MMTSHLSKTTAVGASISNNEKEVNKMKNEVYDLIVLRKYGIVRNLSE